MTWPLKVQPLCERLGLAVERQNVFKIAVVIILVGELLKIPPFLERISGDVWLYFHTAAALLSGAQAYLDTPFGYPPYSLLWLIPPLVGRTAPLYSVLFSCQMMVVDLAIQFVILRDGMRNQRPHLALGGVLVYVLSTVALRSVVLERFDLAPVAIMTGALAAFLGRKPCLSGYLIIFAAGTKAYPLLALPVLATAAWRTGVLRTFSLGCALAGLPLLVLGFFLPWWNFASAHASRGLQVESLYASVIWFAHNVFGAEAVWSNRGQFFDVAGALADTVRPLAIALWVSVCFGSLALSCRAVARAAAVTSEVLIQAATVPVMAFVAFGPVLSPQYLLWLVVPMAVRSSGIPRGARWLFVFCCALTPLIYPSQSYATGITTFQSAALVLRNVVLCGLFFYLARKLVVIGRPGKAAKPGADQSEEIVLHNQKVKAYQAKDAR